MSPVIPHFANECLVKLGYSENLNWPEVDNKSLNQDEKLIVIQVNGKKRNTLYTKEDLDEKELTDLIKRKLLISKYLNEGKLIKTIYVKNRLINFLIK